MLETVRAYAALELTASGHRDDALEGLARYWTGEASRAAEGWSDPRRPSGWIACVTIWRITAAPLRGSSSAPSLEAANIAWGLKYFWLIRGHARWPQCANRF